MSFGIRSIARFSSVDDFSFAVNQAIATATFKAKNKLILFQYTDPDIPKSTGKLVESAVEWIMRSALTNEFNIEVFYNTFYAEFVENKNKFMEKIIPKMVQIALDALREAFESAGIHAEIIGGTSI